MTEMTKADLMEAILNELTEIPERPRAIRQRIVGHYDYVDFYAAVSTLKRHGILKHSADGYCLACAWEQRS